MFAGRVFEEVLEDDLRPSPNGVYRRKQLYYPEIVLDPSDYDNPVMLSLAMGADQIFEKVLVATNARKQRKEDAGTRRISDPFTLEEIKRYFGLLLLAKLWLKIVNFT